MKRWPIIRHMRWLYYAIQVERHYRMWRQLGMLPLNRHVDDEMLNAIWRGEDDI